MPPPLSLTSAIETQPGPGVRVCVGLGANLGDPVATLRAAVAALAQLPVTQLQACSSFYRSAPVDATGPDFINAVAVLHTRQQPLEFLQCLQGLENAHQRERPYRHAPRTLDLDLLLWADQTLDTPTLQVPHPRLHQRAFVLVPLAELLPDLTIARWGSVRQMLPLVAGQQIQKL